MRQKVVDMGNSVLLDLQNYEAQLQRGEDIDIYDVSYAIANAEDYLKAAKAQIDTLNDFDREDKLFEIQTINESILLLKQQINMIKETNRQQVMSPVQTSVPNHLEPPKQVITSNQVPQRSMSMGHLMPRNTPQNNTMSRNIKTTTISRQEKEISKIHWLIGLIKQSFNFYINKNDARFMLYTDQQTDNKRIALFSDSYIKQSIKSIAHSNYDIITDKSIDHALDIIYATPELFNRTYDLLWSTPNVLLPSFYDDNPYYNTKKINKTNLANYHPYPDIKEHFSYLGISDNHNLIFLTWLVFSTIKTHNAFIALEVVGKPDRLKTIQEEIKRQLNYDQKDITKTPKNQKELLNTALENHVINFNTSSKISDEVQQEMVTMLSSGSMVVLPNEKSKFAGTFHLKRPIAIYSSKSQITLPELREHTITIKINNKKTNQSNNAFMFNQYAFNVANLCKINVLSRENSNTEFYQLGLTICHQLNIPQDEFKQQFNQLEEDKRLDQLSENPIGLAILNWAGQNLGKTETKTVKEWLEILEAYQDEEADDFPKTAKMAGQQMTDATELLASYGIIITKKGEKINGTFHRQIEVPETLIKPNPSQELDAIISVPRTEGIPRGFVG